jgi:hypothetical protein
MPVPVVAPRLVGEECSRGGAPQSKAPDSSTARRSPSTLAELVVAPGGSIEIPVRLPVRLRGTGCRIESVVIAHGRDSADLAIDIVDPSGVKPIVSYQQLPPPTDRDNVKRIVRDHSDAVRGVWSPDRPPPVVSMVVADRDLWPTGAVLKLGSRGMDSFAAVAFEIPKDREAPPEPRHVEPPAEELPPYPQPKPLELIAYRHSIGIAATDLFSIILRARERPFGIGVRSDRESSDPRLSYRAPGDADPMPTHLVPQVAVIISRCGRPLSEVMGNIY